MRKDFEPNESASNLSRVCIIPLPLKKSGEVVRALKEHLSPYGQIVDTNVSRDTITLQVKYDWDLKMGGPPDNVALPPMADMARKVCKNAFVIQIDAHGLIRVSIDIQNYLSESKEFRETVEDMLSEIEWDIKKAHNIFEPFQLFPGIHVSPITKGVSAVNVDAATLLPKFVENVSNYARKRRLEISNLYEQASPAEKRYLAKRVDVEKTELVALYQHVSVLSSSRCGMLSLSVANCVQELGYIVREQIAFHDELTKGIPIQEKDKEKVKIFMSYSSRPATNPLADDLSDFLRENSCGVFDPRRELAGKKKEDIHKIIGKHDGLISLYTKDRSENLADEITFADARGKNVLVLLEEGESLPSNYRNLYHRFSLDRPESFRDQYELQVLTLLKDIRIRKERK